MAYLTAGKFAQDYGVVMETDYPYTGEGSICINRFIGAQQRIHVTDYGYVGGFYGGCNEPLMKIALVKKGPLAVSFNVTQDFFQYKGGIYQTTGILIFSSATVLKFSIQLSVLVKDKAHMKLISCLTASQWNLF